MIGFIGTSLQLQSLTTAHTLNSFWTSAWRISMKNLGLISVSRLNLSQLRMHESTPFYNCHVALMEINASKISITVLHESVLSESFVRQLATWQLLVHSCNGNLISDPLFNNGHLLRLHHSGFQPSCHIILLISSSHIKSNNYGSEIWIVNQEESQKFGTSHVRSEVSGLHWKYSLPFKPDTLLGYTLT
jgi:hypothetical protein